MSEFLSVHRENAEDLMLESLPLLLTNSLGFTGVLEFCENYRIKGIVHLLLDAEPDQLHRNLYNSGRAFLHALWMFDPKDVVVSQAAAPLFDAIACNDLDGAVQIARALPWSWQPDLEYEDDYLYVEILCRRFLLAGSDAEIRPLRDRYALAADPDDPRARLLRAIEARDPAELQAGMEGLLASHEKRYRVLVENGRLADEQAETLPFFCVEGLALLRLAERAGVAVLSEYPLIPVLARGDFSDQFTEGSWRQPRGP